jgi:hypothetical protein
MVVKLKVGVLAESKKWSPRTLKCWPDTAIYPEGFGL